MTETSASLRASGKPAVDVKHFYQTSGRLDILAHVVQVAAEARVLAARHDADVEAANLAALAHDLAAGVPVTDMPAVAQRLGVTVHDVDRVIPVLVHGPIASAAMEKKLGVDDGDVLKVSRAQHAERCTMP